MEKKCCTHEAIDSVLSGRAKFADAVKEFGVPATTLKRHLHSNNIPKPGIKPVFTEVQQQCLKDRILFVAKRGFPLRIDEIRKLAYEFAVKLNRRKQLHRTIPTAWYRQKQAGYDWWDAFKKKHSDISVRVVENISATRVQAFNPTRVNNFFSEITEVYDEHDLHNFPQLIYNCDETKLVTVPDHNGKFVVQKGVKTASKVQTGERGSLTTLLPCVNAVGDVLPPFLIFKATIPPEHGFPEGTKLFRTKSAFIDAEIFLKFLQHFCSFAKSVENKPRVLFLDGHASHFSIEAIEFCLNNNVELLCLPPHTTHRLQPLDTHVNGPIKKIWANEIDNYLKERSKLVLAKEDFHYPFSKMWQIVKETQRGNIVNSFQHCGLYPLGNPTTCRDFSLYETFSETGPSQENGDELFTALRVIMPDPSKEMNATHERPHSSRVATAQVLKEKKEKRRNIQKRATPQRTQNTPKMPGTSKSSTGESKCSTASGNQCDICNIAFKDGVNGDFFLCPTCLSWVCENCFGSDACADCDR